MNKYYLKLLQIDIPIGYEQNYGSVSLYVGICYLRY